MGFEREERFDREEYEAHLRRIRYDDRDCVMYENMLKFLWRYIVTPDLLEDRDGLIGEFCHWNEQLIEKCFFHMPKDLPYANIRRAYQSFACLLKRDYEEGLRQLNLIGLDSFSDDGRAPKLMMNEKGQVYRPISRLFLLYNYDKVLDFYGKERLRQELREKYAYAFTVFGDEEHIEHDRFYHQQMEDFSDRIFYPVFERIYKIPWGPKQFYLYMEESQFAKIDGPLFVKNREEEGADL